MIPKIAFAPGSISPTPESHGLIDQATATLLDRPDIHLVIEGHRDSHEPDPAGRLARERAEVVVDLFVQNGVAPGRLCIADFGDTRPIAPSTTAANQSRNRRVELRILAKDESCP
jgi:outer membrane protein OmpA-like peptidoglycan-associated protein